MRPDIPHNVAGAAPSEPNEDRSPLVDTRDLYASEVSRQSCQAAMLGVAISVGTCGGLLLPHAPAFAQVATSVVESTTQSVTVPTSPAAPSQVAIVAPAAATPTPAPTAVTAVSEHAHTVQVGETLWRVANLRGVDIKALASLNQLQPDALLTPGQVLQLPQLNAPKDVTRLEKIARSVPEIPPTNLSQVASNQSVTTNVLPDEAKTRQDRAIEVLREKRNQLQQGLAELGEESKSTSGQSYRVNAGDTLASIARQFGVSYREMLQLNPIEHPDRLQLNQVLQIPPANKPAEVAVMPGVERVNPTPDGSLPVTRLSKTPLPAIGGESPKAIDNPEIKTGGVIQQQVAFNPSNLLTEIKGIQERYQRQSAPYQAATVSQPKDAVVPVVTATAPTRMEAPKPESVNPDFNGRRSDSSLSLELRNFVQPKLKPDEVTGKVVASPTQQRQVIARSTLGAEAYAPVAPTVKRMVAPNLPPIGKEDAYLPGGIDASNGYVWPAKGMLSSGYGWRWGRMHRGIDIAAPIGTPIVSAASGVVTYAGWNDGGYGYMVEVEHADGTMTRYAHNDRILVSRGQQVAQGQQISEMGSTGFSTGPHLHFEIHPRGQGAVNPMAFLNSQS